MVARRVLVKSQCSRYGSGSPTLKRISEYSFLPNTYEWPESQTIQNKLNESCFLFSSLRLLGWYSLSPQELLPSIIELLPLFRLLEWFQPPIDNHIIPQHTTAQHSPYDSPYVPPYIPKGRGAISVFRLTIQSVTMLLDLRGRHSVFDKGTGGYTPHTDFDSL